MDPCPKCEGLELAIDSVDYVTVYGVITTDGEFHEQSHKFFDREQMNDGETRCVACGYATKNDKWPGVETGEPPTDYIEGILLNDGRFLCGQCHEMTEGPAHPCAKPCEALTNSQ